LWSEVTSPLSHPFNFAIKKSVSLKIVIVVVSHSWFGTLLHKNLYWAPSASLCFITEYSYPIILIHVGSQTCLILVQWRTGL
jgi:hypothetical protein